MSGLIAVLDILFVFLQGIQNKQTSDYRDHRRNIQIISDADPIKQIAADDAFQDRSYIQGKTHSAASRRSSSRLPAPANTVRSDFSLPFDQFFQSFHKILQTFFICFTETRKQR